MAKGKNDDEMPGRAKSLRCPYSTDGQHAWSTIERKINGLHTKLVLCRNCGQRP